jgi:WD40 repeat protein
LKSVFSKDFGCKGLKYTHNDMACVYAATKDNGIRYHSFHDNVIIHNFEGHTRPALSLSVSPVEDTFISCGGANGDQTFRMWDLSKWHLLSIVFISHEVVHTPLSLQGLKLVWGMVRCKKQDPWV